jgi:hypothetical protein
MVTPLERATKLIILAANKAASEEEARTVAVQACRIIVENGFVLVPGPRASHASEDVWSAHVEPPRGSYQPPASQTRYQPPSAPYVPRRAARRYATGLGRIPTPAEHFGRCPNCGTNWRPGDIIAYKRGLRIVCMRCKDRA